MSVRGVAGGELRDARRVTAIYDVLCCAMRETRGGCRHDVFAIAADAYFLPPLCRRHDDTITPLLSPRLCRAIRYALMSAAMPDDAEWRAADVSYAMMSLYAFLIIVYRSAITLMSLC